MTDKIAGLGILAQHAGEARERALAAYYEIYKDEPLAIDKWFALQAAIPGDRHARAASARSWPIPAFSLSNPNRARALIGAFSAGNQTQFNALDGSGYDFIAAIVLQLDEKNPQVAARLLGAVQKLARAGTAPTRLGRSGVATRHRAWPLVPRRQRYRRTLAELIHLINFLFRFH